MCVAVRLREGRLAVQYKWTQKYVTFTLINRPEFFGNCRKCRNTNSFSLTLVSLSCFYEMSRKFIIILLLLVDVHLLIPIF